MNVFKQKTAYEIASGDWSSDVCSSDLVRVDFIVTPEGKPYLIEINSIPGMSGGSIVPKQVREAGMTLGELYDLIIEDTYDRDRR